MRKDTADTCFALTASKFPRLGVNKLREAGRLVFEICKRDGIPPEDVLSGLTDAMFPELKAALLRKRYPKAYGKVPASSFYLPERDCSIPPHTAAPFSPSRIFVEKDCADSRALDNAKQLFPSASVERIESVKELSSSGLLRAGYHRRKENLVIMREKYDFFKPCPCTKGAVSCGYSVINTGFGCVYDCSYCFLQEYQNSSAIMLPVNIDGFMERVSGCGKGLFDRPRVGSGEFSDSLVFDHITVHSAGIIAAFRDKPDIDFEFKTKSVNIGGLLSAEHGGNIAVSWSVNPQKIIDREESGAASLSERIAAAEKCALAGYKIGFHFDPVILYPGWEKDYGEVVELISSSSVSGSVAWVSIGTLRFRPELKKIIEARFPDNTILDGELMMDFDGKMRYSHRERVNACRAMTRLLAGRFPKAKIYLCMESAAVWRESGLA